MKESDLHREWARVLDMCEGAGVDPYNCWKCGGDLFGCKPEFSEEPKEYKFAVAILEGKPLFEGDKVWSNIYKSEYIITRTTTNFKGLTWNPPKKTFMLNGEELPCPVKPGEFVLRIQGFEDTICYFNNQGDIKKVENAIIRLLKESTGNGE